MRGSLSPVRRIVGLTVLALWSTVVQTAAVAAVADADAVQADVQTVADLTQRIDAFHAALLEVMQSGAEFDARAALLAPKVGELFDLPSISRISLGRTWKTLDAQSQREFSSLLQELIVATYADRFDSFDGQSFHDVGVEPAGRGWVVKTELERSSGERVTLDYYFRKDRVYNVVADGVSDLSLRRADYNSIIKTEGYEQLLSHIRENIVKHRAGDADD